jgi:hypothetical protein
MWEKASRVSANAMIAFLSVLPFGAPLVSPLQGQEILASDFENHLFSFSRLVPADDCFSYCGDMDDNCREESFGHASQCMSFCKNDVAPLAAGSATDLSGNSLACRMNWASPTGPGGGDPSSRCSNAHASGGNTCGNYCENYCSLAVSTCSRSNQNYLDSYTGGNPEGPDDLFASVPECMAVCQGNGGGLPGFSQTVLDGISITDQQFGYGSTVQCRLHHLQAAIIQPSATYLHCNHASPTSSLDTCSNNASPNSVNYCEFVTDHCQGEDSLFPSKGACRADADPLPTGGFLHFTESSGGHLGCLNYWALTTPHAPENCMNADLASGPCQDTP